MKLAKAYEPGQYEDNIYALWEKSGAFAPVNRGSEETYTIVMPPPNANANLHIGYGLTIALEDAAARYHRMKGEATLLLPGADHAGFETQSVYEKQLAKEGKSRFDFSREELYKQIWDFVEQNKGGFEVQMRKMGASADWNHFTYTLDDKIVQTAYKTFKKMWDEKLIYRGERLVNYCTFHRTGFADIEVVHKEATTPLYYLKYGPFELATTRPETKFGDTAVAVHPDDARYAKYVGKVITVEGVNGPFDVQVIADEMVDPNFGTGVVKITPAHSFDDWEVAQRHNLPAKRIINHDGTLNHYAGRFEGMTIMEARKAVAEALEEKGLLIKVDHKYKNRMGYCYKCGTVIEPMLMDQWFVNMQPLAQKAIETLQAGKITFYPDSKRQQLIRYLEGLKDWNISRQIAWGIPIPAFQSVNDSDDWIYDERVAEEIIKVDGKTYHRDPDVFDTWFSSSSWPYATLGYPDSADFEQFYPNALMETGGEILYPWVSRMIMLGLYNTGEVPFREVYIHGYVMAEDGSKMSKSIGNTVDPMPVIEKYGSDALRMGIMSGRSPAVNRGYDPRRIEEARNFANKLWNVARYIESIDDSGAGDRSEKTAIDHWVLSRLNVATRAITDHLDAYRFSEAYDTLYHLVWDDVADWYIEASKGALNREVLDQVLDTVLRLAHPFAPFVTETIWQTVHAKDKSLLITSSWPEAPEFDERSAAEFDQLKNIISEIRQIKTLTKAGKGELYFTDSKLVEGNFELIIRLAKLASAKQTEAGQGIRLTSSAEAVWLDIGSDKAQEFVSRLQERHEALTKQIKTIEGRLKNKSYVEKAPEQLVAESKQQLGLLRTEQETITSQIKQFI
jgi:valyl-tRNA synthetase